MITRKQIKRLWRRRQTSVSQVSTETLTVLSKKRTCHADYFTELARKTSHNEPFTAQEYMHARLMMFSLRRKYYEECNEEFEEILQMKKTVTNQ